MAVADKAVFADFGDLVAWFQADQSVLLARLAVAAMAASGPWGRKATASDAGIEASSPSSRAGGAAGSVALGHGPGRGP